MVNLWVKQWRGNLTCIKSKNISAKQQNKHSEKTKSEEWRQWKWISSSQRFRFMSQFQTDDGIAHCHWYLTLNFPSHFQSRFWSQWLTHLASITLEQISLFRSTSRFYQVLCMLIHGSHPQLLNPDWQRADCTSRTGGNPCCPKALRPLLKPVGVKPCPGWCPPHKVQATGSWEDGI